MKLKFSVVIILLLAVLQYSSQDELEELAKDKSGYTGPNPEGTPGTPAEPAPVKKPPTDTKTPKTDTGSSTSAVDWVSVTNSYRQKGKNIPDLVWSEGIYNQLKPFVTGLTTKALCETQPFSGMKLQRYGQNAATFTDVAENIIVKTVIDSWYRENRFYDATTKNCTNDDLDVCFHFTQLMWKSTQYFACRVDTCKKGTRKIAICWYIRPGNCNDRDYTKSAEDSPCGPYLPPPP